MAKVQFMETIMVEDGTLPLVFIVNHGILKAGAC